METTNQEAKAKTAILLGATGATGRKLLPLLLDNPLYSKVVTLNRQEIGIEHPKLENRIVTFDNLAHGFQDLEIDDCYCTFGTTLKTAGSKKAMTLIDHEYVMEFAKASLAAGAKRFAYLSAVGSKPTSSLYYPRLKGQTEVALKEVGFQNLAIFQPSMIITKRDKPRLSETLLFPLLPLVDALMVGGLAQYRSIKVETLAHAIAKLAPNQSEASKTYLWREMVYS
ncbi:MAG: hypothetical protein OQJ97_10850 [Rhodospirillales bacterium]|nr:hypothetical protein [Rhodospirillales bacterium]